jgi:hypothetical protein
MNIQNILNGYQDQKRKQDPMYFVIECSSGRILFSGKSLSLALSISSFMEKNRIENLLCVEREPKP